ncbi:hypothetical protein [Natrinema versiforme]|uniref:hypothetical protein n=1 Tax=Natrinema versiforme TaxID=88724 RepID=UPI0015864889|nr:hypothetical protein [Natrinema versiforme]
MDELDPTGFEDPEQFCDAIAELIDALEDADLLTEDKAADLRSEIYQSLEFQDPSNGTV